MNDDKLNPNNLENLDTENVEKKEETILDLTGTKTTSQVSEKEISRNTVDTGDYVDFNELGKDDQTNYDVTDDANNTATPNTENVTSVSNDATVTRNKVDIDIVDINSINNPDEVKTQEEHDQNLNSTTKVNEAGKREVRMEVNETVTRVHEKDNKVKNIFIAILVVLIVIIAFFVYRAILDSKYDLFVKDLEKAADAYLRDDTNASTLYALYNGTIEKVTIPLRDLKRRQFIDFDLVNPKTKEDVTNTTITVKLNGGVLEFIYPGE